VSTVREFDEQYTAPHHGFQGASDYYYRASALRVVDRIARPVLVVSADDDPFVPPEQFGDPALIGNPFVALEVTRGGGHCGFVARNPIGYDGYWAEARALEFVGQHVDGLAVSRRPAGPAAA